MLLIMICFWISYWLISRFLLRPVGGVLQERQRRLDDAESAWHGKKEELASATEELERELGAAARRAADRRAECRAEADAEAARRMEQVRGEADEKLGEALKNLDQETARARQALREEADRLAEMMVSKVLDRELA